MAGVVTGFSIILVVILAGLGLAASGVIPTEGARYLSKTAYAVANPALLFMTMSRGDPSVLASRAALVAFVSAVLSGLVFVVLSRSFFRRPVAETTIGVTSSSYANAANIGLPVATYVVGDTTAAAPLLMLQLVVLAPAVTAALELGTRGRLDPLAIVTVPLRNPLVLSTLAGVAVSVAGVSVPDVVAAPLEMLGGAAVPLMLMAFGITLWGRRPLAGADLPPVLTATVIKTMVMPTIAFLVAGPLMGLHGAALFAVVAMAALPTAQNVQTYAIWYGEGENIARDVALLTTVTCVPVLLLVSALLT
ncbi:AEC family transporter [Kineosporia sp. J2-2]|uniref:AEC family transporter n=1 Tax=Kineosporia corallincola TaxID=2835133 RepID=A0ABS5TKN8_9ACTN|nr:AEC family transporter [Kineosporia corallincola]MBT0771665.1 AEC family transporter [Kineosporia corallincola]